MRLKLVMNIHTSLVPRPLYAGGSGNEATPMHLALPHPTLPFLVGSRILLEVSVAVLKANNFRGSVEYSDD